ncbi:MAG TPA: isocitrate/isopropylmalate family dehydrogenase [Thermoanaerobaculaceae bacterium]|nr:isocitrate/isopropylmalate family dehydrogenase [Thermoanaerobaculaceae bacterium]
MGRPTRRETPASDSVPIRIAVIPGDGIGGEVVAEAVSLAHDLRSEGHLRAELEELDWGAERLLATGRAVPGDGFDRLRTFDAILAGAFGDPRVPDGEYMREILLGLRFQLDLFINMRPVRCMHERLNPLKTASADEIDMVIVRENTEGLYCGVGGLVHEHSTDETALQEMVVTRRAVERIVRAAFEIAASRPRCKVTLVDKANALPFAGRLWQKVFAEVAASFPRAATEHLYADVAAMEMVRNPGRFDVIVTENLFGDLLSDLAAMLGGGLGLAASGNIHPGRVSMFEPVHGSAPDIAGTGTACPLAALGSFGLLLRHVRRDDLADALDGAIADTVVAGEVTPDLGGRCTTSEVGRAVRRRVLERLAA